MIVELHGSLTEARGFDSYLVKLMVRHAIGANPIINGKLHTNKKGWAILKSVIAAGAVAHQMQIKVTDSHKKLRPRATQPATPPRNPTPVSPVPARSSQAPRSPHRATGAPPSDHKS